MNRKLSILAVIAILILTCFASCDFLASLFLEEEEENGKYPKEVWGEWVTDGGALDGKVWSITSDSVYIDGHDLQSITFTTLPYPTIGMSYTVKFTPITADKIEAVVSLNSASNKYTLKRVGSEEIVEAKYPPELWGQWVGFVQGNEALSNNSGKAWYITSDKVYIGGHDLQSVIFTTLPLPTIGTSYTVTFKKISYNVAEAVVSYYSSSVKFMLFSSRTKQSTFTGTIVGDITRSMGLIGRAIGGLGGIQVTVTNLKNSADKATATTTNDGTFSIPETIVGDEFSITANGTTATVSPSVDQIDVGTLSVASGSRVKVRVEGIDDDLMQLYNRGARVHDKTISSYTLKFIFEKYGGSTGPLTINYTCDSGLTVNGAASGSLSLESGSQVSQNLPVRCDPISNDYEIKKINFTMNSVTDSWSDSVSLRFNKEPVRITFVNRTGGPLLGAVKSPAGKTIAIQTEATNILQPNNYSYGIYCEMPKWKNADYLIVITGVYNGNKGAHYSIGFGEDPPSGSSGWALLPESQWDDDEPNDTEEDAKLIEIKGRGSFVSYIRSGNLDYFKVRITD